MGAPFQSNEMFLGCISLCLQKRIFALSSKLSDLTIVYYYFFVCNVALILFVSLGCSQGLKTGSANFFAWRTGLSWKISHELALKISINIQQLNFISAHFTIVIQ